MRPDGRPNGAGRGDGTRLFFALWPAEPVARRLQAIAEAASSRQGGRVMRRETVHLTLVFLGDVASERLAAVRRAADAVRTSSFSLCLDRLGYWPHNRITWAGCRQAPPAALVLFAALSGHLRDAGFALEKRPFTPHVTLLRKANPPAEARPVPLEPPLDWPVDDFVLVQSVLLPAGSSYQIVGRWPLDPDLDDGSRGD